MKSSALDFPGRRTVCWKENCISVPGDAWIDPRSHSASNSIISKPWDSCPLSEPQFFFYKVRLEWMVSKGLLALKSYLKEALGEKIEGLRDRPSQILFSLCHL